MSTNHNGSRKRNGGKQTEPRSVRFAPSQQQQEEPPTRRKRPRLERPNQDEDDDVDDWVDDEEHVGASAKELLDAKRSRRLKRDHVEEDETAGGGEETHIDAATSMLADDNPDEDDFPIEPFNMDAERTDGSGYFDGDTYVFRKRDEDEEPDAWLESLGDGDKKLPAKQKTEEEESSEAGDMDELSSEELCARLLPLVSDSETVLQALVRYGELLKRGKNTTNDKKSSATSMAQEALNSLTEASNALLLKGDVDIYQKTRKDLMELVPKKVTPTVKVQWEYRGNQDGKLHGPYTTEQMKSWTGAGYFVGEQAVQIRTVAPTNKEKSQKPTVDDLLSDLMDDDEQKDDEPPQEVRGEWMSSNDVDFSAYS